MKRLIKFNAWIEALGVILTNVSVNGDGSIRMPFLEFYKQVVRQLDHLNIYIDDGEIYKIGETNNAELWNKLFEYQTEGDYIKIVPKDVELLQFTGRVDIEGNEIYDQHILLMAKYNLKFAYNDYGDFENIEIPFWCEKSGGWRARVYDDVKMIKIQPIGMIDPDAVLTTIKIVGDTFRNKILIPSHNEKIKDR